MSALRRTVSLVVGLASSASGGWRGDALVRVCRALLVSEPPAGYFRQEETGGDRVFPFRVFSAWNEKGRLGMSRPE
jgi:hypothetical protein